MNTKDHAIFWVGVFAVASTIAWAFAASFIYGPPKSAHAICAEDPQARASAFCVALAQKS